MKKRNPALTAILLVLFSCSDQDLSKSPTATRANVSPQTAHLEPAEDPTTPPKCYAEETEVEYNPFTGEISTSTSYEEVTCPIGSTGGGGVSTQTCTMHFPANPTNGQKYVATGSCFNSAYYYSCTGSTWVQPADHIYGTPPSNPYSGLRYMYDYTAGGSLTYIYLANTGSNFLPNGWYIDAYQISSTNCAGACEGCIALGYLPKGSYGYYFYGTTAPRGAVLKLTARPLAGGTTTVIKVFSLNYTLTADGNYYTIVGTAKAPNGTTVTFNDNVAAP